MALPSDLVSHYSSRAFQTRVSALTAVGAVLASSIDWIKETKQANFIGFLLILVIASLGELNRRYTYSYLCACYAAATRSGSLEAKLWTAFRKTNEGPWKAKSFSSYVSRFMLSWSTYLPGLVVGNYLILRDKGPLLVGWIGVGISMVIVVWWIVSSINPLEPPDYRKKSAKGQKKSKKEQPGAVKEGETKVATEV